MKRQSVFRRSGIVFAAILLAASLALPNASPAAPGGTSGPPEGKGRKPVNPGGIREGSLYGDQWFLIRDLSPEGDGKPVLFQWTWPEIGEEEFDFSDPSKADYTLAPAGAAGCVQPFSIAPILDLSGNPLPKFAYSWIDSYGVPQDIYLIPLDAECNIPDLWASTWGEQALVVDAGRLNLARTTQYVLDAAYEEALTIINSAAVVDSVAAIALDPAGRLLLHLPDGTEKIIDAPRENLALYQRLMKDGCLSPGVNGVALTATMPDSLKHLACDSTFAAKTKTPADLVRAASFLAGAADKFGHIGVDEVIYINSTLKINDVFVDPANGTLFVNSYFDFLDTTYRRDSYSGKKVDLLQPTTPYEIYPAAFDVIYDIPVKDMVFSGDWNGELNFPQYPVLNFTRATDDALSVIYYIHNYELPVIVPQVP